MDYDSNIWNLPHNIQAPTVINIVKLGVYTRLLDDALLSPLSVNNRATIVSGHPGIGKSTLAHVIMKRIMIINGSFLYSDPGCLCIFGWNAGVATVYSSYPSAVYDPNTLWISNQREHGPFALASCRMVLLCSNQKRNWGEFNKVAGVIRAFIPIPTEGDVLAIAQANQNITVAEVNRRITIAGCVPRSVCSNSFQSNVEDAINSAIDCCSFLADIYSSQVVTQGPDDLSNCIFYDNASAQFERMPKTFLSAEVCKRYMKAWARLKEGEFRSFISSNNNAPGLNVEYGKAFEVFAHGELCKGGTFHFKKLHSKDHVIPARATPRGTVSLPPLEQCTINNTVNFLTLPVESRRKYLKPQSGNFGAVDSLALEIILKRVMYSLLFQITCNRAHGMNGNELNSLIIRIVACLHLVPNASTIRLIFVVPDYLFEQYKVQSYTEGMNDPQWAFLEQWVMGIPTSEANRV